ncbi:MAG: hypothetical protein IJ722_06600 [Alloprevotella sp.]|nr:hypothetical protein [Alloprevotella sp.]
MHFRIKPILFTLCLLAFVSCGDNDNEVKPTKMQRLSGHVEKGPFVQGSEVTLHELTADFSQTGKSFRTQTEGALGAFSLNTAMELVSQYAELSVSGFYYHEVRGELSAAPITLRALADVSGRTTMNVNLLTHLTRGRTMRLIAEGKPFNEAKAQAGRELLSVFAIEGELPSPENVSIAEGSRESGILLAISTILLHDRSDAQFTELLSAFSTEFAESGRILSTAMREAIRRGQAEAHPSEVVEKMQAFYAERGMTLQAQDFSPYIDFNGDGVIDEDDKEEDISIYPDSQPVEETWFTGENIGAYVNGLYYLATLFASDQLTLEALRLGKVNGTAYGVNLGNPNDNYIRRTWEDGYSLIGHLNQGIASFEQHDFADKHIYLSRLLALRALTFYQLTVLWGNVPYYTDAPGIDVQPRQLSADAVLRNCAYELRTALNMMQGGLGGNFAGISKPYFLDYDAARVLLAEIELTIDGKTTWDGSSGEFCLYDNRVDDRHLPLYTNLLRQPEIPVVSHYTAGLLQEEASGTADAASLAREWQGPGGQHLGVWAALKRLGQAQALTGCKDHELLLPIPYAELMRNTSLRQNPGY